MLLNTKGTADLVTITEEILSGQLHFLCSGNCQIKNCENKAKLMITDKKEISAQNLFLYLHRMILNETKSVHCTSLPNPFLAGRLVKLAESIEGKEMNKNTFSIMNKI